MFARTVLIASIALAGCAGTEHIHVQPGTDEPAEVADTCDAACECELIEQAPVMTSYLIQHWQSAGCADLDALFTATTEQL